MSLLLFAACGDDGGDDETDTGGDTEITESESPDETTEDEGSGDCAEGEEIETDSGLKIEDITCGDGAVAEVGAVVTVHYELFLEDGTPVQSSREAGTPFPFQLGAGNVIAGWDEGV